MFSYKIRKVFYDPEDSRYSKITCSYCGKTFWLKTYFACRYKHIYCNRECKNSDKSISACGEKSHWWKGGRIIHSGYIYLKMPDDSDADSQGYVAEHRIMAREKIGRTLLKNEDVHHLNGIKTDNRPENIVVITKSQHAHDHKLGIKKTPEILEHMRLAQRAAYWKTKKYRQEH